MDIKNKSQFIEYFSKGIKSQNNLKIGVEHERFLFEGENKKRISYETLKKLFENLKVNGWEPLYEKENIIGMQRDNQQITTEPGLQCELSDLRRRPVVRGLLVERDRRALILIRA